MRSMGSSSVNGMPLTLVALTTGTISSPWPPSTMAWISSTAQPSSMAMKQR